MARRRGLARDKFNGGQKIEAAFLGAAMVAALVTGVIMRFAPSSWITCATGATLVHDALFFAIVVAVLAHIAFALSRPDQLVSMFNGRIPRAWAKMHAAAWLSESRGRRQSGQELSRPTRSEPDRAHRTLECIDAAHAEVDHECSPSQRGDEPADLLLTGGSVFVPGTREWVATDLAIADGTIAGWGPREAHETVDVSGAALTAGFVDAHMHLESTKLWVDEFVRTVLPHGTTAVAADPHEIANVFGVPGVLALAEASAKLPFTFGISAPSCVPASQLRELRRRARPAPS